MALTQQAHLVMICLQNRVWRVVVRPCWVSLRDTLLGNCVAAPVFLAVLENLRWDAAVRQANGGFTINWQMLKIRSQRKTGLRKNSEDIARRNASTARLRRE